MNALSTHVRSLVPKVASTLPALAPRSSIGAEMAAAARRASMAAYWHVCAWMWVWVCGCVQ